jgi:hypothetical protein
MNLGINWLTQFSPFMDTSPDGRDKIFLLTAKGRLGCKTMRNLVI